MEKNVSIIIPTYKRGDVVKYTLPSYINQKHVKEVIIVDDGSFAYDSLKEMIKSSNKIKYFSPHQRLGLPGARNYGIARASGDYIIFGEDDVEFPPDYVELLLKNMKIEKADIIGGRQIFVYSGETKDIAIKRAGQLGQKDLYICYPTDVNFSVDLGKNVMMHTLLPFALFRRSVFKKLRYDESIKGNYHREETDLYISALEKGFRIIFCNSAYVWHLAYLSRSGGCRTQKKLEIELSLLINNIYFWRKHYNFLAGYLKLRKGSFLYYVLKYPLSRYLTYAKRTVSRMRFF